MLTALRGELKQDIEGLGGAVSAHADRRVGELGGEVSLRLQSMEAHIATLQQRDVDFDSRLSSTQEAVDQRMRAIQAPAGNLGQGYLWFGLELGLELGLVLVHRRMRWPSY